MSEQLATVEYGKIFLKSLRTLLEATRDEALSESATIIRREEEASMRQRWYRTGASVESLQDEVISEGDKKAYRLSPTTFYSIFGEYGTGQRGRETGEPAPVGYTYGPSRGMAARRFSRIAIANARPQIEDVWRLKVRELAAGLTR